MRFRVCRAGAATAAVQGSNCASRPTKENWWDWEIKSADSSPWPSCVCRLKTAASFDSPKNTTQWEWGQEKNLSGENKTIHLMSRCHLWFYSRYMFHFTVAFMEKSALVVVSCFVGAYFRVAVWSSHRFFRPSGKGPWSHSRGRSSKAKWWCWVMYHLPLHSGDATKHTRRRIKSHLD